jgi:hypothetical protein
LFKQCGKCAKKWETINDIIMDPELSIIGYQVNLKKPSEGLVLFLHSSGDCNSTLGIKVFYFHPIYKKAITDIPIVRPTNCPGYCLDEKNFEKCLEFECNGNYVRNLIQIINEKRLKK